MAIILSSLPLWSTLILLVILPTCLAMCGPVILRRWIGHQRLASNNEIAGFKFATVGVIYAVMIAFAVVVVWQKFSDAETAVIEEAGASATLYRLTAGSETEMAATHAALNDYLRQAIDKDWPRMSAGKGSPEVTQALNALYAAAVHVAEGGTERAAISAAILNQLDGITHARRTRLQLAAGIVPGIIWLVLYCGAVLTVCFTFFFATQNLRAQVLMTGILSSIVFMGLLVVVSIDHPFTGPTHVESDALQAVLDEFGGPDNPPALAPPPPPPPPLGR